MISTTPHWFQSSIASISATKRTSLSSSPSFVSFSQKCPFLDNPIGDKGAISYIEHYYKRQYEHFDTLDFSGIAFIIEVMLRLLDYEGRIEGTVRVIWQDGEQNTVVYNSNSWAQWYVVFALWIQMIKLLINSFALDNNLSDANIVEFLSFFPYLKNLVINCN